MVNQTNLDQQQKRMNLRDGLSLEVPFLNTMICSIYENEAAILEVKKILINMMDRISQYEERAEG